METRGGLEYGVTSFFNFGTELSYDTEEHAVAVIPQIWLTFPHKVTLKCGYSYDFGVMHKGSSEPRSSLSFNAIHVGRDHLTIIHPATLKAFIALIPAGMLFLDSIVLFFRAKTVSCFLHCSVRHVWLWSFLLISAKHFTYFPPCTGVVSIASVIISIFGAPFLVSRCFQSNI